MGILLSRGRKCVRMHLFDSVVQRCFCLDVAYAVSARGLGPLKGVHGAEAHGLYNRNRDVFGHFGSAFNNMKFIL
jgi:hypothetical protein